MHGSRTKRHTSDMICVLARTRLACTCPLVHASRVLHVFFISFIFSIMETRVCKQRKENTLSYTLFWYIVFLLLNFDLIYR